MKQLFLLFVLSSVKSAHINNEDLCSGSIVNVSKVCSLDYYLCHNGLQSGMTLLLSSSLNHTISNSKFCLSENLSNVTIKSDSNINPAFITCNKTWTGFGFYNTNNLTFNDLVFHQCGGEIQLSDRFTNESNFYFGPYQKAVLLFSHCTNTHLESVSIMGYGGFGIVAVNALGNNTLAHINVTDNHPCSYMEGINGWFNFSCSGSGIVFLYIQTQFSTVPEKSLITTEYVVLYNNFNVYEFKENIIDLINPTYTHLPLISGGGLTVVLASNQHQVNYQLTNALIYTSAGTHAGGILLQCHNSILPHIVRLQNLTLSNNGFFPAQKHSNGMSVFVYVDNDQETFETVTIEICNSTLKESKRNYYGGGLYMVNIFHSPLHVHLIVEKTFCIYNTAAISGMCMYVEKQFVYDDHHHSFGEVSVDLVNIVVYHNDPSRMYEKNTLRDRSVGVLVFVAIDRVTVTGNGSNGSIFTHNHGSAIEAYSSDVKLAGHLIFHYNNALFGAAISLRGMSYLLLTDHLSVSFIGNHALTYGGAIYAEASVPVNRLCVFQIHHLCDINTISLNFTNNSADLGGHSLYIQDMYNCYMGNVKQEALPDIYDRIINVSPHETNSISSKPITLCHCFANVSSKCEIQPAIEFYSGQIISILLNAYDAVWTPVYATVLAKAYYGNWNVTESSKVNELYGDVCNQLNFTITGYSGLNDSVPGFVDIFTIDSIAMIRYSLRLLSCPFGFSDNYSTPKCACSPFLYSLNKHISCDIQTVTISLPYSSWFGNISSLLSNNTQSVEGFSSVCPPEYCYPSLTTYNATMLNPLCQYGRTGIICGQCNDNLSLVFGSDECQECSNLWLLSILGYALIGLLLVLLLFILNLTVSNGTLGGLVFFANMSVVSLHTNLLVDKLYTLPVKLSLSFLNLNLGYPMCFYHGMDIIGKIGLQFVFPVYLWSLVLGLVIISRYSTRISNLIVGSSVQVLATLIQLSFAKLLLTVSDIFTSAEVHTTHHHPLMVWYFGGNITYLSGGHLVLFLLSLLTSLLFLLPYLVITTIASHLRKYRLSKHFRPLIDAYHGPYKDRLGYWFGVRQWLVVFLYIVYAEYIHL